MANRLEAVFFDRDGVLIEDRHYLADPAGVELVPGARDLVWRLTACGVRQFIVTNQSGVARGLFAPDAIDAVHASLFDKLGGNHFDAIAVCPHHPFGSVSAYAVDCECRKPKPGLVSGILADFSLTPAACCLVGDKQSDIAAAESAGICGFRFDGGNLQDWFNYTVLDNGGFVLAG